MINCDFKTPSAPNCVYGRTPPQWCDKMTNVPDAASCSVTTKLCLSPLVLTFCTIVKLSIKETVYDPGWHKCTPYLLYLSTYCPIFLLSFSKDDIAELDKMFVTISVDEL